MSTTSVPRPPAAASSSASRSLAALVMSTSAGVTTTRSPLIVSTGNPASGIRARLPLLVPPDHEQGDVVADRLAADQGPPHRGAGPLRGPGPPPPGGPPQPLA